MDLQGSAHGHSQGGYPQLHPQSVPQGPSTNRRAKSDSSRIASDGSSEKGSLGPDHKLWPNSSSESSKSKSASGTNASSARRSKSQRSSPTPSNLGWGSETGVIKNKNVSKAKSPSYTSQLPPEGTYTSQLPPGETNVASAIFNFGIPALVDPTNNSWGNADRTREITATPSSGELPMPRLNRSGAPAPPPQIPGPPRLPPPQDVRQMTTARQQAEYQQNQTLSGDMMEQLNYLWNEFQAHDNRHSNEHSGGNRMTTQVISLIQAIHAETKTPISELEKLHHRGLLEQIPYNTEGEITSIGSIRHSLMEDRCSPCIFWFKGICAKGIHCHFCHFKHKGQKSKRIKPSKKTRLRNRAKAEEASMAPFDGDCIFDDVEEMDCNKYYAESNTRVSL